jgi:hypothetical protein
MRSADQVQLSFIEELEEQVKEGDAQRETRTVKKET